MRIGVISDTHGLLRPEATAALAGVDRILHLGDVGDPAILLALQNIAPLTAIRGNVDVEGKCAELPSVEMVDAGGLSLYLLHNLQELDLNPSVAGFSAVLSGHTHQPKIEWRRDVLYFNPGSAGPRRFQLPVSIGFLEIEGGSILPSLKTLLL